MNEKVQKVIAEWDRRFGCGHKHSLSNCNFCQQRNFLIRHLTEAGQRTQNQNNALHKLFELWAEELNAAGYTVQLVLAQKIDLEWDGAKVKELLWRPAQEAILKKKSTTELKKIEDIDKVYEHLNRHLGEKFFVHVPFPNDEEVAPLRDKVYQ